MLTLEAILLLLSAADDGKLIFKGLGWVGGVLSGGS